MRRDWEAANPLPRDEAAWTQWSKQSFAKVEKWMDQGHGECWFSQAKFALELRRSILHMHEHRYEVGRFVIMANHCHLVIRPFDSFELENEIGSIKSVTARFINSNAKRSGLLWQQESYDRIVRDAEHLYRVVQYIGRNPKMSGVEPKKWFRWMNPSWEVRGCGFCDAV